MKESSGQDDGGAETDDGGKGKLEKGQQCRRTGKTQTKTVRKINWLRKIFRDNSLLVVPFDYYARFPKSFSFVFLR